MNKLLLLLLLLLLLIIIIIIIMTYNIRRLYCTRLFIEV